MSGSSSCCCGSRHRSPSPNCPSAPFKQRSRRSFADVPTRKRKSWSKETVRLFGEFDFYEHKFLLIKPDLSFFRTCGSNMSGVEWLLGTANEKKMHGHAASFFRSIIETEERRLRLVTQKTKIDTDWDHWYSL